MHISNAPPRVKLTFTNEPFPEELSAIFGDIVHNLRTALDLAASACVRANGKSDKGVFFPFCKEASELDAMIKRRNIDRAHPDVVSYIRSLAPYKGGNIALRAIHDLDVRDKH